MYLNLRMHYILVGKAMHLSNSAFFMGFSRLEVPDHEQTSLRFGIGYADKPLEILCSFSRLSHTPPYIPRRSFWQTISSWSPLICLKKSSTLLPCSLHSVLWRTLSFDSCVRNWQTHGTGNTICSRLRSLRTIYTRGVKFDAIIVNSWAHLMLYSFFLQAVYPGSLGGGAWVRGYTLFWKLQLLNGQANPTNCT